MPTIQEILKNRKLDIINSLENYNNIFSDGLYDNISKKWVIDHIYHNIERHSSMSIENKKIFGYYDLRYMLWEHVARWQKQYDFKAFSVMLN